MALLPPPLNEKPTDALGNFNQAWSSYFQRLQSSGAGGATGTTTNDNATAGKIGEYLSASGSVALSSLAATNVTSLALTAGDWDVSGNVRFNPAPTTRPFTFIGSVSATSGSPGARQTILQGTFPTGQANAFDAGGMNRFSLGAAATVYLVATAVFTTAGMTATGSLTARRAR